MRTAQELNGIPHSGERPRARWTPLRLWLTGFPMRSSLMELSGIWFGSSQVFRARHLEDVYYLLPRGLIGEVIDAGQTLPDSGWVCQRS